MPSNLTYLDDSLMVRATPVVHILEPHEKGGMDFATTVLSNPWEFNDAADVRHLSNVRSYVFTQTIPELEISWSSLYGESSPAPPGGVGDPGVWVLYQSNNRLLDADTYHRVTLKMYVPGDLDVGIGAVARVAWLASDHDPGVRTDDIVLYPGLREYVFDMKKIHWDPPSSRQWTGLIRYVRIDPHEFSQPRAFYIDSFSIRTDDMSAGIFPVRFRLDGDGSVLMRLWWPLGWLGVVELWTADDGEPR